MSSEMIVMTFRHRTEAQLALEAIRAMRKSPILSLESVVVATKNRTGEITLRSGQPSEVAQKDRDTRMLLVLADLMLCAPAKGAIDAIADRGMDRRFILEVAGSMAGESSALFVLTRENGVHDAGETRSTLALFKGRIHQTGLSSEVEAYLGTRGISQGVVMHTNQRKEP